MTRLIFFFIFLFLLYQSGHVFGQPASPPPPPPMGSPVNRKETLSNCMLIIRSLNYFVRLKPMFVNFSTLPPSWKTVHPSLNIKNPHPSTLPLPKGILKGNAQKKSVFALLPNLKHHDLGRLIKYFKSLKKT